jgi:hypothetical protein
MDVSPQDIDRQLPTPEVSQGKKFFGDASITLPEKAMHVEAAVTERRIAERMGVNLDKCKVVEFDEYKRFYLEAKGLMRALKPHLTLEDKEKFDNYWGIIGDILQKDAHVIGSVEELTEFLLQALNNANLSELGVKSHINEILSEIDLSGI